MIEQEIIDGNKLIAEFMSWKNRGMKNLELWERFDGDLGIQTMDCKFHNSWDSLMPVIEKILNIVAELDYMEKFWVITDAIPDIEATWQAVINFIKWNNETDV